MLSILICYKLKKVQDCTFKKAKTHMTKEDKGRMHMSRCTMCSVQKS